MFRTIITLKRDVCYCPMLRAQKFSADPGRYRLTDIQCNSKGCASVEIRADYVGGSQLIEKLQLSNSLHPSLSMDELQVKDGRKNVQAQFVTSEISLNSMFLNALCDSYDDSLFHGEPRPLFRLHRKLAPYKISFAVTSSLNNKFEELHQLAQYLCKQLRSNHISSLLLPSSTRTGLHALWCHYDQLGIPYSIVLNESTLKNGIALLRSRDTTLKEEVHIAKLPLYVEQLYRNY